MKSPQWEVLRGSEIAPLAKFFPPKFARETSKVNLLLSLLPLSFFPAHAFQFLAMATEIKPLPRLRVAKAVSTLTPEQKYWSTFSSQTLLPTPTSTPITHISSNSPSILPSSSSLPSLAQSQSYIAITTGPRLQLLSTTTLKPVRTITRTTSSFHGATVRRDGRLALAGSESGTIQAFDSSSRAILKTWSGEHRQPVWVTKWHPTEPTTAMSCSDDGSVRLWDLPAERSTWVGFGHTDYVRCGGWVGDGAALMVSGGYDRAVRLWDPRVGAGGEGGGARATVMEFRLKDPVEEVLATPAGTALLAAAGEKIAVLDLVAARPLHVLKNHQKTVTSLAFASQGRRLLSGALDGHVKVFDTDSWSVVAGFKYPSPILALDVVASGADREDKHICVGMQSGLLSIRTRLSGAAKAKNREKEKEMEALIAGKIEEHDRALAKRKRGRGWEKRLRGKDYTGEGADIVIDGNARGKIRKGSPWEVALRKGQYEQALDIVLEKGERTEILTLLTALVHRSALRTALKGRNAQMLMPLLKWLNKAIQDPRHVRLTTDTAMLVLDLYGENMGQSPEIDHTIARLHEQVRQSVEIAQTSWSTLGMLETLKQEKV